MCSTSARSPDPNAGTAFEKQVAEMMAIAAGPEIAVDVRGVAAELQPELMIVDCMLPAGIAAGESTGIPTVSLVHFPYGLARTQMLHGARAWTTDRAQLNITRSGLGLEPARDDLAAWESPELLLVTVPGWVRSRHYPANVLHAGPLCVTRAPHGGSTSAGRPLVLLSFSTTVMQGQVALSQRVCEHSPVRRWTQSSPWRYRFGEGNENSVRGVNLMRVRDGRIMEALGT